MRKRLHEKVSTAILCTTLFLFCLLIFLTNPILVAAEEVHPVTTILLLRHAERAGDAENSPLTHQGKARAEKLAQVAGWAGVKAIYSTTAVRALATAQPLAECLDLKPIIYDDVKLLINELVHKHAGQTVLVVSHTGWIRQIIDALAGPGSSAPADSGYDSFHVLTVNAPGKASLVRLKYGETVTAVPCASPQ